MDRPASVVRPTYWCSESAALLLSELKRAMRGVVGTNLAGDSCGQWRWQLGGKVSHGVRHSVRLVRQLVCKLTARHGWNQP